MSFENPAAELVAMCLVSPENLSRVLSRGIKSTSFADAELRQIFSALEEADRAGRSTKAPSIAIALPHLAARITELRANAHVGLDTDYFVDELLAQIWHSEALRGLYDLQRLAKLRRPFEDTSRLKAAISDTVDTILRGVDGSKTGPRTMTDVLESELAKLEAEIVTARDGRVVGIPTGILALDQLTSGGLKRGSVNVFAARTGIGKTTLALNLAHHAAAAGHAVCYFTVEMPAGQLARKLLSLVAAIKGRKLTTGDLSDDEIDKLHYAVSELHKVPIWIDDSFKASFESFEFSCRKLKRQGKLDVIVVDYIQQLTLSGRHQTKQAVVTEVSHRLKQLAISLDVTAIVLAQFNRDAEKEGAEPSIWQVKDSGAIEQDCDLGVCLFRDEKETYWLKVDKNRWGKDRVKFPIQVDLSVNAFKNANIRIPEDW